MAGVHVPVNRAGAAETEVDDNYDPFADYSEFQQAADEEADINFFRNGRFFTVGLLGGYRAVTGDMNKLYGGAMGFGVFLDYFFDLRFALQMSFLTANHIISYTSPSGFGVHGDATISDFSFSLKYYMNTQNVTRGLAKLNPFIIGGYSLYWRTTSISGVEAFGKDTAPGFHLGLGIELPMLRNKMFFGGQVTYDYVSFHDENSQVFVNNGSEATGLYPRGDFITALAILGVNF